MPENDFEKKIKRMMDDFHLSPSASVWEKVSSRLNEKRRRKMPFFFLLAAGLLTAGYFIYYVSERSQQNSAAAINYNSKNDKTSNDVLQDSTKLFDQKLASKKEKQTSTTSNTPAYKQQIIIKNESNNIIKKGKSKLNTTANSATFNKNSSELKHDNTNSFAQHLNNQIATENNSSNVSPKDSFATQQPATADNANSLKDFTQDGDIAANILAKPDSITAVENQFGNSLKKSVTKTSKTPKWQLGVTASYAKSNLIENLTHLNIPSAQYLPNAATGGNYDTVSHSEHAFSPSDAYAFGAVVKKKIFKKHIYFSRVEFYSSFNKSRYWQHC